MLLFERVHSFKNGSCADEDVGNLLTREVAQIAVGRVEDVLLQSHPDAGDEFQAKVPVEHFVHVAEYDHEAVHNVDGAELLLGLEGLDYELEAAFFAEKADEVHHELAASLAFSVEARHSTPILGIEEVVAVVDGFLRVVGAGVLAEALGECVFLADARTARAQAFIVLGVPAEELAPGEGVELVAGVVVVAEA